MSKKKYCEHCDEFYPKCNFENHDCNKDPIDTIFGPLIFIGFAILLGGLLFCAVRSVFQTC